MEARGVAGTKGDAVRSDCHIEILLTEKGGYEIIINSKVESIYGQSIKELCEKILLHFEIKNCKITIEDKGALPFVLSARLEAAIKNVVNTEKEFLPDLIFENKLQTSKDAVRRSRLYLPGNSPKYMINAGIHSSDGIILDLEDSVAPDKKEEARLLVRNALRQVNFYQSERMVRINQLPMGLEDLKYIVPHNINVILIPKCESPEQIWLVKDEIKKLLKSEENTIFFMPIIESALGVIKAYDIASACDNVIGLAIGLEDYTSDLGTPRTSEATESFFARAQVVNAAAAAGIQAIDSVFSDVSDHDGLKRTIEESKKLGFKGMGCIHPRQVEIINKGYLPDEKEIEKSKKIVLAFEEAKSKGLGVVALGSKMIDKPVVDRALKTIELAIKTNTIPENWRENDK